jgi:hypothetical protein
MCQKQNVCCVIEGKRQQLQIPGTAITENSCNPVKGLTQSSSAETSDRSRLSLSLSHRTELCTSMDDG